MTPCEVCARIGVPMLQICDDCQDAERDRLRALLEEGLMALMHARAAMHNDWHDKPRIGMESPCADVDAAIADIRKELGK